MWGSTVAPTDPCQPCPASQTPAGQPAACRRAIAEGLPLPCQVQEADAVGADEPKTPRRHGGPLHWIARHYEQHLHPGEIFSASDLAQRAGSTDHAAATWLVKMTHISESIRFAGKRRTGQRSYIKLYRYVPLLLLAQLAAQTIGDFQT
jgi:hypothetical protein